MLPELACAWRTGPQPRSKTERSPQLCVRWLFTQNHRTWPGELHPPSSPQAPRPRSRAVGKLALPQLPRDVVLVELCKGAELVCAHGGGGGWGGRGVSVYVASVRAGQSKKGKTREASSQRRGSSDSPCSFSARMRSYSCLSACSRSRTMMRTSAAV